MNNRFFRFVAIVLLFVGSVTLHAQTSAFSRYDQSGPHRAQRVRNVGPRGAYDVFRPRNLGANGMVHPIITWGNGTGASVATYARFLEHLATHGFVVVASRSSSTGSGQEMADGVRWLLRENQSTGSDYYQRLNPEAIGATGHSQGGAGTINAAKLEERITSIAPLAPATFTFPYFYSTADITVPMFLMVGANDNLANPRSVRSRSWNTFGDNEIGLYGELAGAGHFEQTGSGGKFKKYVTAWFDATLFYNSDAIEMIFDSRNGALHNRPTEWSRLEHQNLGDFEPITNEPPVVSIVLPSEENREVLEGSSVALLAHATDPDGTVEKVEFFAGFRKIGEREGGTFGYFRVVWSDISAGVYRVVARATDDQGATAFSDPITITVLENNRWFSSPLIAITPSDYEAEHTHTTSVQLDIDDMGSENEISAVEIYANDKKISEFTAPPYNFTWTEMDEGVYTITAVATDNTGVKGVSEEITVAVKNQEITRPEVGFSYKEINNGGAPIALEIDVDAVADPKAYISAVEILSNHEVIAVLEQAPFSFRWDDVEEGEYKLSAVATDNVGNLSLSEEVEVTIGAATSARTPSAFLQPGAKLNRNSLALTVPEGETINVKVFNLRGAQVFSQAYSSSSQIPLKELGVNGTYILRVKNNRHEIMNRKVRITH
ncbi:Ig-like domain-containing protein [Chitinispirillales bacterium ANBcel5]|uniref:Ig-like domain-containing protein n=1 Tax=Cellulosispirillum alkaliphilum TaxID=3039283 RepID=UPI002A57E545|nr:Ig-like domain-containing protein [Chitinispirillales bacterium ANBcel5]